MEGWCEMEDAKNGTKRTFIFAVALAAIYGAGFVWFALSMKAHDGFAGKKTDAIIVLTGDGGRIEAGIRRLASGAAGRLYISGVNKNADKKKLIARTIQKLKNSKNPPKNLWLLTDRIDPGGKAESTIGNAVESVEWARRNNVKSIRLITSFYHMPRALMVFRRHFGPDILILPESVADGKKETKAFASRRTLSLAFSEYNKYIATYLWGAMGFDDRVLASTFGRQAR